MLRKHLSFDMTNIVNSYTAIIKTEQDTRRVELNTLFDIFVLVKNEAQLFDINIDNINHTSMCVYYKNKYGYSFSFKDHSRYEDRGYIIFKIWSLATSYMYSPHLHIRIHAPKLQYFNTKYYRIYDLIKSEGNDAEVDTLLKFEDIIFNTQPSESFPRIHNILLRIGYKSSLSEHKCISLMQYQIDVDDITISSEWFMHNHVW